MHAVWALAHLSGVQCNSNGVSMSLIVATLQSWVSHRHSTDDVVTAWYAKQESSRCGMVKPSILDMGCGIGAC